MEVTIECQACGATEKTWLGRRESHADAARYFVKKGWQYIEATDGPLMTAAVYWRCPDHYIARRKAEVTDETT